MEMENIRHKPDPDFGRLRKAVLRQGMPDRLPLFEVNIDDEVLGAFLGEPVTKPGFMNQEDNRRYAEQSVRAYHYLGYDYVMLPAYLPMKSFMNVAKDTAALAKEQGRAWVDEKRGPVTNWQEFESFDWSSAEAADCLAPEYAARILPEGMGLIVRTRGMLEWLLRLLGFETLGYALADSPDLVQSMVDKVEERVVGLVRRLAQMDRMGAIVYYDDMGYKTSTMVSPACLRRYVFPCMKKCAQVTHEHGLPFILHACGNLERVMNDLIDDVGIDAKHSYEDVILPMAEVKAQYGKRIGILGGVDMNILTLGPEERIRATARQAIADCAPGGGFAFGSGNTIANYIPLNNYLAMLDEAWRVGGMING